MELLLIIDMVESLDNAVGLPKDLTIMYVSCHEVNAKALVLQETLPPQYIPQSIHYAKKTLWFCEEVTKQKSI